MSTELWVDAAAARCLARASLVLVGADTLAPVGLVHKIGTLGVALAARYYRVPVYALGGGEKLLPRLVAGALSQRRPRRELLRRAPPALGVANYYYDLTPLELLAGVVAEGGVLAPETVAAAAAAVAPQPELVAELIADPTSRGC
jgi:translation initiation factor 2B subunit (eIF-2B alpha/beta/delta family)